MDRKGTHGPKGGRNALYYIIREMWTGMGVDKEKERKKDTQRERECVCVYMCVCVSTLNEGGVRW